MTREDDNGFETIEDCMKRTGKNEDNIKQSCKQLLQKLKAVDPKLAESKAKEFGIELEE